MSSGGGFTVTCDSCSADISSTIHIRCAECDEYELCVPCFAQGATSRNHKPWHDYTIDKHLAFPIFNSDWGADEELAMINGFMRYGIGNWAAVADCVGGRTNEELSSHYQNVYLQSENYPMPESQVSDQELRDYDAGKFSAERLQRTLAYHTFLDTRKLPEKPPESCPGKRHAIPGFMPARLEFEREIDNDAEVLIEDVVFEPQDTPLEHEFKLTTMAIYNKRLMRRASHNAVLFTHDITDVHRFTQEDKTSKRLESVNRLKKFARLLPPDQYNAFRDSMLQEQTLRQEIAQLQEYRQNGIKSYKQVAAYEKYKRTRLGAGWRSSYQLMDEDSSVLRMKKTMGDLAVAADADKLSLDEGLLCSVHNVAPRSYLALKAIVLRLVTQAGGELKRGDLKAALPGVKESTSDAVYDLFCKNNWCAV